jgi:hypothetical protein
VAIVRSDPRGDISQAEASRRRLIIAFNVWPKVSHSSDWRTLNTTAHFIVGVLSINQKDLRIFSEQRRVHDPQRTSGRPWITHGVVLEEAPHAEAVQKMFIYLLMKGLGPFPSRGSRPTWLSSLLFSDCPTRGLPRGQPSATLETRGGNNSPPSLGMIIYVMHGLESKIEIEFQIIRYPLRATMLS